MRAHVAFSAAATAILAALLFGCAPAPQGFSSWQRPSTARIAIFPLANYSATHDAPDLRAPILSA